jgi:tetratricopeptide (TPR) repeat protein
MYFDSGHKIMEPNNTMESHCWSNFIGDCTKLVNNIVFSLEVQLLLADYQLERLNTRDFEHLVQGIGKSVLTPALITTGDGADQGREAYFEGKLDSFPSKTKPWDGYIVLQAKFRQRPLGALQDGKWVIKKLKEELDDYADNSKGRRCPEYYIFAINIALTPGRGGWKDKADELIKKYQKTVPVKAWFFWDYGEICRFLDLNSELRRVFPALLNMADEIEPAIKKAIRDNLQDVISQPLPSFGRLNSPSSNGEILVLSKFRPSATGIDDFFKSSAEMESVLLQLKDKLQHSDLGDIELQCDLQGKIAQLHFVKGEYDLALGTLNPARQKVKQVHNSHLEGAVVGSIGQVYVHKGLYNDALEYLTAALDFSKGDAIREGLWKGYIGEIYFQKGELDEAYKFMQSALNSARDTGDSTSKAYWTRWIGVVKLMQGKFLEAKGLLSRALRVSVNKDYINEVRVRKEIAQWYSHCGQYENALNQLQIAINIADIHGDKPGIATCLIEEGGIHNNRGDYSEASAALSQALGLCDEMGDKPLKAMCLANDGLICLSRSDYENASAKFKSSLTLFNDMGNIHGKARVLALFGQLQMFQGQTNDALVSFRESRYIYNKLADKSGQALCGMLISQVRYRQSKYNRALMWLLKALHTFETNGEIRQQCLVKGLIGTVYKSKGDIGKALSSLFEAKKLAFKLGDKRSLTATFALIGHVYQLLDKTDDALIWLNSAKEYGEQIDDKANLSVIHGSIGQIYLDLGNIERALTELNRAHEMAVKLGDKNNEAIWLASISHCHKSYGNFEKALEFQELALNINLTMNNKHGEATNRASISTIYLYLSKLDEARVEIDKAIELIAYLEDEYNYSIYLGIKGQADLQSGNYEQAHDELTKALAISHEILDKSNQGSMYHALGQLYFLQEDNNGALKELNNGLRIALDINSKQLEGNIRLTLSQVFIKKWHDLTQFTKNSRVIRSNEQTRSMRSYGEQAENDMQKALTIAVEIKDKYLECCVLVQFGQLYAAIGKYLDAKEFLAKAIKLSNLIGVESQKLIAYEILGQIAINEK